MKRPTLCLEKEPTEQTLDLCTKPLQVYFKNYYRMLDTIHLETEAIEMCTERSTQLLYYVDHVVLDKDISVGLTNYNRVPIHYIPFEAYPNFGIFLSRELLF